MNNLSTQTQQTMSSIEIAELTGKSHSDVLRDIRKILEEMNEGGESKFASSYLSSQNKQLPCFNLPRRECDIVISGYSLPYRTKIIDRWHDLEKSKPSVPMTYLEALKELVATQELLEAAKPAIAFHGQLYAQNRAISINEYAKLLSDTHECIIGPNKLMDFLRNEKILMKGRDRHEKNMPYQKYLNCKWFEVEYHQTTVGLMATPMILPLGQTMLAEKILDHFKI